MSQENTDDNYAQFDVRDILVPFFDGLKVLEAKYCVLHSYSSLPNYVRTDLDIALDDFDVKSFESFLVRVAREHDWEVIQRLWYDIPKCFYYVLRSLKEPRRWLAIDILIDPYGIGRYGFSTSALVKSPVVTQYFLHSEPSVEFCYKLTKRIRKGEFKKQDARILNTLYKTANANDIQKLLAEHFGRKYADMLLSLFEHDALFTGHLDNIAALSMAQLIRKRYGSPMTIIRRSLYQLIRITYRLIRPSGLILKASEDKYQSFYLNKEEIFREVGPAFRRVVFKKQISIFDACKALATSTLLIGVDIKQSEYAFIQYVYFGARRKCPTVVNTSASADLRCDATIVIKELIGVLRRRMLSRLAVR